MCGEPLAELNRGLQTLQQGLVNHRVARLRVEVAIVSFGAHDVSVEQDFVNASQFQAPTLTCGGTTPMGEAINLALDLLRQRKDEYQDNGITYYRPWLILISDGYPDSESVFDQAAARLVQEETEKGVLVFAIGVEGADGKVLARLSNQRQPMALDGLNFVDLFDWVSNSLGTASAAAPGDNVGLDTPGWGAPIQV